MLDLFFLNLHIYNIIADFVDKIKGLDKFFKVFSHTGALAINHFSSSFPQWSEGQFSVKIEEI